MISVRGERRLEHLRRIGLENIALVLDVDGVLTDGTFLMDENGYKIAKTFGADDNDALKELRSHGVDVFAVSADTLGWDISENRLKHMGIDLYYAPAGDRVDVIREQAGDPLSDVIYIGDGWHDDLVFDEVGFGIAPKGSSHRAFMAADYTLSRRGGDRAVAEAVHFLLGELL